jgi:hypothetical protein
MTVHSTRRRFLTAAGSVGILTTAGCLGSSGGNPGADTGGSTDRGERTGPPVADRRLPQDYTIEQLNERSRSGGPRPDGIPSIDEPRFSSIGDSSSNLVDRSPVFGVEINGDARAYPQNILVWHEIVNDVVGGESVAVTYCPLTGTAQGFYRGDVTFGVSGQLINTNLVMFDRATRSYWPQILAQGITGPHEGDYLDEFQVVWTTWRRWRETHPETRVLSEDTGFARNYGADPYGSYLPPSGYYSNDNTLFAPLQTSDRFPLKEVVIGARNEDGAMAVQKALLRDNPIVEGSMNGVDYISVYDQTLDTGYVYRNPGGVDVDLDGLRYVVEGESYDSFDLPLEREIAFDAMWLAWFGYYPSTVIHE